MLFDEIIGKCLYCDTIVNEDMSYSNKHKNIICNCCVNRLSMLINTTPAKFCAEFIWIDKEMTKDEINQRLQ